MSRVSILTSLLATLAACDSTRAAEGGCSQSGAGGTNFEGVIRATIAQEKSRNLFRLPKVASTEIRPAEPAICAEAERALAAMKTESTKGSQHKFYVFHVGTSFAIGEETPEQDGDVIYFFDPQWRFLSNAIAQ
jgi:hypothetical protein